MFPGQALQSVVETRLVGLHGQDAVLVCDLFGGVTPGVEGVHRHHGPFQVHQGQKAHQSGPFGELLGVRGPHDARRAGPAPDRHRRTGPPVHHGTAPPRDRDAHPPPPIEHERAHGTGHGLEIIKGGNQPLPQITATRQTSPRKTQGLTARPSDFLPRGRATILTNLVVRSMSIAAAEAPSLTCDGITLPVPATPGGPARRQDAPRCLPRPDDGGSPLADPATRTPTGPAAVAA